LPFPLTPTALLHEHASIPRNRKVAEAFFYVKLIEQWGSGTTRMADELREAGLPEPEFDESTPSLFRLALRQDPFSEERLQELGLNERQKRAVAYAREHGKITNTEYQRVTGVSKRTATRELATLTELGILVPSGTKGRSAAYSLKEPQKGQWGHNGAIMGPTAPS